MTLRELEAIAHCLAVLRDVCGVIAPGAAMNKVMKRAQRAVRRAIEEERKLSTENGHRPSPKRNGT